MEGEFKLLPEVEIISEIRDLAGEWNQIYSYYRISEDENYTEDLDRISDDIRSAISRLFSCEGFVPTSEEQALLQPWISGSDCRVLS